MKGVLLIILLMLAMAPHALAQSTLPLQKLCADEAKKYVSDISVKFTASFHYNRKLDGCFVKVTYPEKGATVTVDNVFENRPVAHFASEDFTTQPTLCFVGNKNCESYNEFELLVKAYMEE